MVKASLSRLSLAFAGLLLLSGLSCNPKLSGTSDVTINQTQTGGTFGAPGTDFQIAVAQDTIVVPAGGIGTNGLAISWINCAPATISVEIDGLPAGIANAFSVNPTPDLTSVTLTADPTVPAGTYTVRLKGIAGSVLHDTHFSVIVPDPLVPDFSLALAPSSLPITAGGSGSLAITVERIGGFAAPLAFTLDDAPAGVTGTFTTVPLPMKQGAAPAVQTESHSLLINVPAATAPGTYTLHVHATGGGQDHRIGFLVKIAPAADFALNANPASVTVNRTDAFAPPIAVAITRASTFTGAVAFTVSGLPAGVTGTFTPNPTSSTATALNLSLTLPAPGIYPLKITGTSGTLTHSTTVLLTVNPGGPDFQVSAPATTTVDLTGLATGSKTATVPVTLTQLLGFNRPVTLSVTGLPAGVTGTFAPNPATPSAISTLTLTVPASTPPGTRTVTLNADGGSGLVHTTTFQLVIVNPGTFTLSASPNPVNLVLNPAGGATTATSAISLVPANGFASAVTLSASGLPAGVTAAFSPNPTTGTSTLTFTATTPTAVAGTATVTLNGVSGAVGASTTLTLNLLPGADFTLSPASSAVSALPGGTATAAYTVNPLNGFTGTVAFSVSGLPAGVTAAFAPTSSTTGSTLTLTVGAAVAPGAYTLTVTGTSGALTHTATLTLQVRDFALSLGSAAVSLPAGGSATDAVTITALNGFTGSVNLSLTGAPAGLTGTFTPNPATTTSTLTLNATTAVAPGTYALTVQGVSGGRTRTTALSVTVQAFTLSATSPVNVVQPIPAAPANTGSSTVSITQQNGFTGSVTLSTSALPAGVTAAFGTNPATTSSVLTFTVTSAAAPGSYPITITGVSGGLTRTTTTTLAISAFPDFSLGLSAPTLGLPAGSSKTDTVSITGVNGFASSVTLSLTGAPAGITATFSPNPATTTSTMTLSVASTVATGTYTMNVQGVGGGLTHTTALSVTVQAFTLSATSPVNVVQPIPAAPANTGSSTVTITQQNGFTGNVTLSTSALPAGVTAAFGTNPATTNSVLTFSVSSAAAPGSYTITITGTSGGLTRTTTTTLAISAFPDFSLGLSTPSLSLPAASSTTDTVAITGVNGFASTVTLSLTGAPAGITATFSPNPATTTSTMTLSVGAAVAPGTYAMNVQGVSGGLTHTTALSVTVQAFALSATSPVNVVQPIPAAPANTGSSTVTITQQNGFAGNVTLSTSALPTGVTAAFGTNPATTSSILTFTVTSAAAPGSYTITITGVSGGLTRTTTTTLVISAFPDFSLGLSAPSLSLPAASSTTDTVSITGVNGFASSVTLSLTGAPAGITATFSPNPATTTSTMTLSVGAAVAPGTYTMNVQGVGGGLTHTTALSVTVQAFALSATSPVNVVQPIPAAPANTGSSTVTITQQNGFTGNVTLSTSALPAGVTAAFGTNPATTSSALTFTVTSAAAPGSYTITITGTSSGLTRTTTTTLAISAFPDFSLGLSTASLTVQNGLSTTDAVSITGVNGFTGSVTLSLVGAPAGITATFSPNPATTSSTMTLATSGAVTPGTYAMNVQGVSGGLTHTTALSVTVTDFSLSAPASLSANIPAPASPNTSATGTITVNALSGFTGTATLSASGLPAGVTASFSPNPTGTTSTMTLSIASTAAQGTTTVTVSGVSGGITRSTTFSLVLNGGFSLSLSPATATLDIPATGFNSSANTLTATAFAGFSGNVTLSASGAPAGTTVTFTPNPVATGASSTMVVQVDNTALPGTYTITVNGVSGAQTASTTLGLTLQNTNFALSASPNPVSFQVPASGAASSTSGSTTVSITELGTGSGSVSLSLLGLPTGVTGAFATNPATGSTTLTLTAGLTAVPGTYSFTVQGGRGIYTNTATVGLTLSAAADFSLTAAPDPLTIQVPEPTLANSGGTSITVNGVNGYAGSVSLSASGLPAGTSAAFGTNPTTGSSLLTVTVGSSALPGSYTITVTGSDGNITRSTTFTLALTPAATFTLGFKYGTLATFPGGSIIDDASLTTANGFSNPVSLSLVSPPAGISATFSPNPMTSAGYSSAMTLSVANTVAAGNYSVTVQATDGFTTSTYLYTVVVQSFAVTVSPEPTIHRGSSALSVSDPINVTVTALNGYTGTVNLSIPNLPATGGNPATVSYLFGTSPNTTSVSVGGLNPTAVTVVLTANTSSGLDGSVIPGVFAGTLTSSDGNVSLTNSATVIFEDFSIPFVQTNFFTSATTSPLNIPIAITRDPSGSPFDEDVTLSIGAGAPAVWTYGFGTTTLVNPATSSTLILTSASGGPIPAGTYYVPVTGTSTSGIVRTANVAVTISGLTLAIDTPQFILYGPQSAPTGGSGGNLTVTPDPSGYSGSVTLSAGNFNGLTWSFGTNPLAVSSPTAVSTTYNFSGSFIAAPLQAGVYYDSITANDGAGSAPSQPVTVVVEDFSVADAQAVATASSGYTGTVALTLSRLPAGFPYDGDVAFSASDTNGLFNYTFSPATVTNPGTSTVMSFTPSPTAIFSPGQVIPVTVTATDAVHGVTHTATVTLTIADFLVQPNPASITIWGSQALSGGGTLAVPMAAGITAVNLSATNSNGIAYTFGANPVTPAANPEQTSTTFSYSTGATVFGPGIYTDTLTGADAGGDVHSANVTLTVYDFTITGISGVTETGSAPSIQSSTVTINRGPAAVTYPSDLSMYATEVPGNPATGQFGVYILTLPAIPAGTSTGNLSIQPNFATIPVGTYTYDITVYDYSGNPVSHVGTLTITVN